MPEYMRLLSIGQDPTHWSGRRMDTFFWLDAPPPHLSTLPSRNKCSQAFPFIFAYCKQSKTGWQESLGTRLVQQHQNPPIIGICWVVINCQVH